MKSIIITFAFLLTISTFAFSQDTLYVYKAGVVAYKSVITEVDSLSFSKIYPQTTGTVLDVDGNSYNWRTIGTQTWMTENLKTSKYRNGDPISNVTVDADWSALLTGAWCYQNNNISNNVKYGKLYNWFAVSDVRNIAPIGWHVATADEWTTLENYVSTQLGTSLTVGKALAATTDWTDTYGNPSLAVVGTIVNNTAINNSSNFKALPGGERTSIPGYFANLASTGSWWCSTQFDDTSAYHRGLQALSNSISHQYNDKQFGFSVRCVRD